VRSDTEVAQGTVEYAKHLKVLTDLTGQNAKAASEAARKEMLKGDILAQLTDPKERDKFMETLKYIPEDAKLGFMEFVSTGGKFVRDTATNIVLTQNKELGKLYQGAYQNIRDPSKKLGDALDYVWNQSGRVGQASREAADQTLPFALRMNALSGDTAKAAQMMNAFNTPAGHYDFIIKLLLTSLTLSVGFKGGEVTPLFFIGATLGSAMYFFIPLPLAILAAMGLVAVFAGATDCIIASIVLGIELFGLKVGTFIGIASIVAYFCSGTNSIYNAKIKLGAKFSLYTYLKNISKL
jgi:hypothetical protein